jgi:hypothetical protein
MNESKPPDRCSFCNLSNYTLWHVLGNLYTCEHCAKRHKLKTEDLRKVEVAK